MTGINPKIVIGASKTPTNVPKLTVGTKITAEIVKSTRLGLEIQLDQTKYLLKPADNLQETSGITFSVTKQLKNGQYKVQILGLNDRSLQKSMQGELTPKAMTATAHDSPATITKGHRFNIVARLATVDGKALGLPFIIEAAIPSESGQSQKAQPMKALTLPLQLNSSSTGKSTLEARASLLANPPIPTLDQQSTAKKIETARLGQHVNSEQSLSSSSRLDTSFTVTQQSMTAEKPNAPHQTMMATVIGRKANDAGPLLKVETGHIFKIEQAIDLPIGATLQLTVANSKIPFVGNQFIDAENSISRLIKLLEEIEHSVTDTTTSRQSNVVHQLPKPDRYLVSRLLQLIELQQASVADGLGLVDRRRDETNLPKQDFLRSLLSDMGHAMADSLTDGWRGTTLPLESDPAQAMMIYYREHMADPETEDDSDEGLQNRVQRAVFDINFKHLGRCQVDALCQEQRFDLQVRSERQFSSEDQQMMTDLFVSACEIAGFKGDIGYKLGQFIEPAKKGFPGTTFTT